MRLKDKVILVTGSTTGIGEAIARRAVAEGARCWCTGATTSAARRWSAELGERAALHVDDIADPAAPTRMVAAAIAAFGKLDALVNNAASVERSNLSNTDAALFDKIMAINVRAPLLLIQAAVPHLKATQGCVLNIGSVNGYCGEANLLAYSISKGGLMTLSRNLADALGRDGVRVNHFNVGWVLTPNEYQVKIADGLPPDWPERVDADEGPLRPVDQARGNRRGGRLLDRRREPADQRQRAGTEAVSRDRPQSAEGSRLAAKYSWRGRTQQCRASPRSSRLPTKLRIHRHAATRRLSQSVHGSAGRRRLDDDPPVGRSGRDARHRRAGVLLRVPGAQGPQDLGRVAASWSRTRGWRSRCSAARPTSRIPIPRSASSRSTWKRAGST